MQTSRILQIRIQCVKSNLFYFIQPPPVTYNRRMNNITSEFLYKCFARFHDSPLFEYLRQIAWFKNDRTSLILFGISLGFSFNLEIVTQFSVNHGTFYYFNWQHDAFTCAVDFIFILVGTSTPMSDLDECILMVLRIK